MEYLDKVLGIEVAYKSEEFEHLPNFIATRYRLQMASMNGQRVIFLYPKTELEQIEVLKKHIARIQKNENLPVVLVLNELSFRQKEYLIREKIPFIVDMLWVNRAKKASRATAGLTTDPMSIAMPIPPTFEATLSSFGHGRDLDALAC